ncbi:unnamed protein product [Choristocarpus tenellus]
MSGPTSRSMLSRSLMGPKDPLRVVAHIDMDAFYAQVEQGRDTSLRGQPVAVVQYPTSRRDLPDLRADDDRVVSSSASSIIAVSYQARPFGVKRGMKAAEAQAVCPSLKLVQVPTRNMKADISHYRESGIKVVEVLEEACGGSNAVEKASTDEVYIDVTVAAKRLLENVESYSQDVTPPPQTPIFDSNVDWGKAAGGNGNRRAHAPVEEEELGNGHDKYEKDKAGEGEGMAIGLSSLVATKEERGGVKQGYSSGNNSTWERIGKGGWFTVVAEATGTKVAGGTDITSGGNNNVADDGINSDGGNDPEGSSSTNSANSLHSSVKSDKSQRWWSRPLHRWGQDEMLLACGAAVVAHLRKAVFHHLGYTCSAGVAHNKLLAKVGSNMHKPNGQTILPLAMVPLLFETLPLEKVRGWGGKLGHRLKAELGVSTAGEVSMISLSELQRKFGEQGGRQLWERSQGIDREPVKPGSAPKSIGSSKTFPGKSQISSESELFHWLTELSKELCERLVTHREREGQVAATLVVGFCLTGQSKSTSRSGRMGELEVSTMAKMAMGLLRDMREKEGGLHFKPLSLLSLSAHSFQDTPKNVPRITNFFRPQQTGHQITPSSLPLPLPKAKMLQLQSQPTPESEPRLQVHVSNPYAVGIAGTRRTAPSNSVLEVPKVKQDEEGACGLNPEGWHTLHPGPGVGNDEGCGTAKVGATIGDSRSGDANSDVPNSGRKIDKSFLGLSSDAKRWEEGERRRENQLYTVCTGTVGLVAEKGSCLDGSRGHNDYCSLESSLGGRGNGDCGNGSESTGSTLDNRLDTTDHVDELAPIVQIPPAATTALTPLLTAIAKENDSRSKDKRHGQWGKTIPVTAPTVDATQGLETTLEVGISSGNQCSREGQVEGGGQNTSIGRIVFGRGGEAGRFGEVDPEVLAALPVEIQREVWMQQGGQQGHSPHARRQLGKRVHSSTDPGRGRGRGRGKTLKTVSSKKSRGQGQQGSITTFFEGN